MDDLISRQAAIDLVEGLESARLKGEIDLLYPKVVKGLIGLPSAQSEIVRCKDCKFWREHKYAKETKRYIPFCGLNAIYTKSDDFCSKGERRTDECNN